MSKCPRCHQPIRGGVSHCPGCGQIIESAPGGTQVQGAADSTRDFAAPLDNENTADTLDATRDFPPALAEDLDPIDATRDLAEVQDASDDVEATCHLPGALSEEPDAVDATRDFLAAEEAADSLEAVDATQDFSAQGQAETDDEDDAYDATREFPAAEDVQDTVDSVQARGAFGTALPSQPAKSTNPHEAGQPPASPPAEKPAAKVGGTLGMPLISDSVDSTRHLPSPASNLEDTVDSVQFPIDADATIFLEDHARGKAGKKNRQPDGDRSRTINFRSSGESGTVGRLKRLWRGAADSSDSPMHTLKGNDALATDSVFGQVAKRVLGVDANIDIAGSINTQSPSLPEKRARVQDCISVACRHGDADTADYNLVGFLGQGGMGVVLKAHQKAIGREVAIKMIQPSMGQSTSATINSQKKKFFYEAQITGKLDHPNIVPIYEVGVSNEVLFYSMKMIVGTEWKDVIASKDREDNLEILMKVADAMAFAHQKRIIHRDLKPENVMLGPFGEVLVTDWGCAVDLSRKESFTGAGSPPWMAPEMADHNILLIGPRSDIYLLGAILYQIIAGHPPHPGRTVFECIAAAQKNVILPLAIDDPLLDIALRAMRDDPNDRYQTVEAMQDAIREYRRHAESIQLAKRSDSMLAKAIESKDYEAFSRTVFGFQDAVELWPENSAALAGLASARLAYGECAFAKGDFDLCLQSLDCSLPEEAELHAKAAKAKATAEEREGRFKALRKVLAAVILGGLAISSSLAGFAWLQWGRAEQQTALAMSEEQRATTEAENARAAEETARIEAEKAKAEEQRALIAEVAAKTEQAKALAAQKVAEERTAEVELGSYQSKLALSLGQVKQRDIGGATNSLRELVDQKSYAALNAQAKQPEFDNWAVERVKLLSNSDLLASQSLGQVHAVSFSSQANIGAAAAVDESSGLPAGLLHILSLDDGKPQLLRTLATPVPIAAISLAPAGDELVYALVRGTGDENRSLYRLKLTEPGAQPEPFVAQKGQSGLPAAASLQSLLMTDQQLVGGINGGLWVWSRADSDWHQAPPRQLMSIRGRLHSMHLLDASRALLLTELDGHLDVHSIHLGPQPAGEGQAPSGLMTFDIPIDSEFARESLSAIAYADGNLILGTESGRLFTTKLSPQSSQVGPAFREILPHTHASPIKTIRVHENGQAMLSIAQEPIVHVWKASPEQLSGWQLNTTLAGIPENLAGADFMFSPELVLGIGLDGNAIVWDVPRQKQRQQLQRIDQAGNDLNYASPVIRVVASQDSQRAVSVHRDGTLDSWSLLTGQALPVTSSIIPDASMPAATFSYIGHSPGAVFTDMALDEAAGILVTSALLPDTDQALTTAQPLRSWEVCKWDLLSGNMLDRWIEESATELQLSLAAQGQQILYARNGETLVKQANSLGQVVYANPNVGSYFGVVHPLEKQLMITVKSNGAAGMLDTTQANGGQDNPGYRIDYSDPRNGSLRSDDEMPLTGQWSPDGKRFYMIWESGRITEFVWENSQLSVGHDLHSQDLARLKIDFNSRDGAQASAGSTLRLSSRWQVDLKVRSEGQYNLVFLGIRFPGSEHRLRLARIAFPQEAGEIQATKVDQVVRGTVILNDGETPAFDRQPVQQIPVADSLIVATRCVGDKSYLATASGTVYQVGPAGLAHVFGRPDALDADGNRQADRIVTLLDGGALWRADLQQEQWSWQALTLAPASTTELKLSPDGQKLLLTASNQQGNRELLIANAERGTVISTIPSALCGAWNARGDLVTVMADGAVLLRSDSDERRLGNVQSPTAVRDVHFFVEPWSDPSKASLQWVMIHTQEENGDAQIEYLPMSGAASDDPPRTARLPEGSSVLACSPNEGIFAVGGRGAIQIHFAAPSLALFGANQLFSLEGHAGADIQSLTFTPDGKTLISSDTANRQFAWLSEDPVRLATPSPPNLSTGTVRN